MSLKDVIQTYDTVRALKPCVDPVTWIAHSWTGTCADILALGAPEAYRIWAVASFFDEKGKYQFAAKMLEEMIALMTLSYDDVVTRIQTALQIYFATGTADFDDLFLESAQITAAADDANPDGDPDLQMLTDLYTIAHFAISPLPDGAFYSGMMLTSPYIGDDAQLVIITDLLAVQP